MSNKVTHMGNQVVSVVAARPERNVLLAHAGVKLLPGTAEPVRRRRF